jgi:hypothetical protein
LVVVAKEWVMRTMYIISIAVPAMYMLVTPDNEYKPIRFLMVSHMKLFTLVCMALLSTTDNFDKTRSACIRSFTFCFVFMISQVVMFFGNVAVQTPSLAITYIAAKVSASVSAAYFCLLICHFQIVVLRRVQWGRKLSDIPTAQLCFLVYSFILQGGTVVNCAILVRHGFDGYKLTVQELLAHQVVMVIYSLLTSVLPVRIARIERGRAKSTVARAKSNVVQTLNAPLRVVLSELDSLLDDAAVMAQINRQGAQRLARIAFACDSAVESLRKVADMPEEDVGKWLGVVVVMVVAVVAIVVVVIVVVVVGDGHARRRCR